MAGLRIKNAFTVLLVLAFLFFGFLGIVNHEMWLDEVQAWLIARDSSSIFELFQNLRYEGHPALWHLGLYGITRFTHEPIVMQIFHLIIATGVIYIFAKFSPFTKLQKILFSFGYFPFYEYNIISRNYAIGLLLIFCFCALFPQRRNNYFLLSLILFLLSNTNIYGLIIAIALALTLIFESILDNNMIRFAAARKWDLIISLLILLCGLVISIFQMVPPPDASFASDWVTNIKIGRLGTVFLNITKSYVPIPNFFQHNFWNSNLFTVGKIAKGLGVVFSLGLLFFSLTLFVRKPVVAFLYLVGTFGMLLFMYLKYPGSLRHCGHFFILFITCLWLSSYYTESELPIEFIKIDSLFYSKVIRNLSSFFQKYRNSLIMAILYTHLTAGIFAFTMDLHYPFYAAKEVSDFIKREENNDILMVEDINYVNFLGPPLSTYLNKIIYYVGSKKSSWGSFIIWNNDRVDTQITDSYKNRKIFQQLDEITSIKNENILLVLERELDQCRFGEEKQSIGKTQLKSESFCGKFKNFSISEVSKFTTSMLSSDVKNLYLYLIHHK